MHLPAIPQIALWSNNASTLETWRTELRAAELAGLPGIPAAESPAGLAQLVESLGLELICTDEPRFERLLAQRPGNDEARPLGLIVIGSPRDRPTGDPAALEYQYLPGNLTRLYLPANAPRAVFRFACQLVIDAVRLRRQMQQVERAQQALVQQALIDALTGLPNRRAWEEELTRRDQATKLVPTSLALAIFDLDCFKAVNDGLGHDIGDATLRAAARTLRQQLRGRDAIARIGGDEFGLLISGVDRDTAERIVERVRCALSRELDDAQCPAPAASAGVAIRPADSDLPLAQLFQRADQALLQAKRQGRGRTVAARE